MKTPIVFILLVLPAAAWSAPQLLHPRIIKAMDSMGNVYMPPEFCGNVVRIRYDGSKIADGSPSYWDNATGKLIVDCPSPMIRPTVPPARRVCPPARWKCKGWGSE